MKKLPKVIYVSLENAGEQDEYLQAETSPEEISADGTIGLYELKEVKTRRTEIHLD